MAIDVYDNMKVSSTPSLLEVISHKGFRMTGEMSPGHWFYGGEKGLRHATTTDINPKSIVKPTSGSLYSCKGYAHFYQVYPDGFIQNSIGRPDNYRDYVWEAVEDTAFSHQSVPYQGASGGDVRLYITFPFLPGSYKINNPLLSNNVSSWVSVEFASNKEPTLIIKKNDSSSERKGYVSFNYQTPNSSAYGNRSFAVYLTQGKEPQSETLYPSFEIYRNPRLPLDRTNGTNPYILPNIGTYTFSIGGFTLLRDIVVRTTDNENLQYTINKYTTASPTGEVGRFTVSTPSSPNIHGRSVLRFILTTTFGDTLTFFVSF